MGNKLFLTHMFLLTALFFLSNALTGQNSATDYLKYAVEATEKKDFAGAIALCDLSISLDEQNELAFYHRAYNRFMIGDFEGAIDDANKSIELNSSIADTYLLRAEAKLKLGYRMGAMADYNRARRLDGSSTIAHFAQNFINVFF